MAGALVALVFAGCDGSATVDGAPGPNSTVALNGTVYELDGQNLDMSGVEVTVMETGASAMTDLDGSFAITGLAPGRYSLGFDTSLAAAATPGAAGEASEHPEVDLPEGSDRVRVRVAIEDGEVRDFAFGNDEVREAAAIFEGEEGIEGVIRFRDAGESRRFEVCVGGLEEGTILVFRLRVPREGAFETITIGDAIANADGRACMLRDTAEGHELPGGVGSLEDLSGLRLTVTIAGTDDVILVGETPDLPAREEEDDRRDDDEEEGDDRGDGKDEEDEGDDRDGKDEEDDDDDRGDGEDGEDEEDDRDEGDGKDEDEEEENDDDRGDGEDGEDEEDDRDEGDEGDGKDEEEGDGEENGEDDSDDDSDEGSDEEEGGDEEEEEEGDDEESDEESGDDGRR